jgi:hypothetical protein
MPTMIELLDTYEIANRIVDESAVYCERGDFALVNKARELTQAKRAWDDLRKMPVNDLGSPNEPKHSPRVMRSQRSTILIANGV